MEYAHFKATAAAVKYHFTTIDDPADPNFNELLGLNNEGKLVGFYGSGAAYDRNRGYVVRRPYGQSNFKSQNYPHSVQMQIAAINNKGALGGWYSDSNGDRFGCMLLEGVWYSYQYPGAPKTTKLFALNDSFLGVGYYATSSGRKRAFELDVTNGNFTVFTPPHAVDAEATGIDGRGDVAGWLTTASGKNVGWLWRQGYYTEYSFPKSTQTVFLGITLHDAIVGSYVDKGGSTHGFLLTEPLRPAKTLWQSIDVPNAANSTVVTGVNVHRDLVGYYVDEQHNTHGFLATPGSRP